ncbi:MAG TPA: membrane dipeptidase [Candidatus Hydrogenedentes bacterium]|nr:membrane dipeptidase [Candidatus Hydrogenedentota bacterium]HNT89414.1 membrane dipeptidase [Candidatus Hydrogenedentota bacterium]
MRERLHRWGEWAAFSLLGIAYVAGFALVSAAIVRREAALGIAGAVVLALLVWVTVKAPVIIMTAFNRSGALSPTPVSDAARRLHASIFVADLHADTMMWPRDFLARDARGHVDLPRMIAGNAALEIFTATTKTPVGMNFDATPDTLDMITPLVILQGWPRATWTSLLARALHMGRRLCDYAEGSGGRFRIIENSAQLDAYVEERAANRELAAGVLGIQGAQCLEGRVENVEVLFAAGFRLIGLAHFFDNEVGGSAHGVAKGGLTLFGREVLERMQALRMVIDLAHAAPALIDDVLAAAAGPVIVSHSGPKGVHDTNRTLSDDHIRAIAATGGVVGIGFWRDAVGPGGLAAIVRAIGYVAELVGDAHVALGSDYDGMIAAPFDIAGLPRITEALLDAGFSEQGIRNVMGENALRVLRACLPPG